MKKRIISFILTVLMVVAMIPAASFTVLAAKLTANGVSVESSGLKYNDDTKRYTLGNLSGKLLYTDGSSIYHSYNTAICTDAECRTNLEKVPEIGETYYFSLLFEKHSDTAYSVTDANSTIEVTGFCDSQVVDVYESGDYYVVVCSITYGELTGGVKAVASGVEYDSELGGYAPTFTTLKAVSTEGKELDQVKVPSSSGGYYSYYGAYAGGLYKTYSNGSVSDKLTTDFVEGETYYSYINLNSIDGNLHIEDELVDISIDGYRVRFLGAYESDAGFTSQIFYSITKTPAITVNGVEMYDGNYLANGATKTTTTKPSGGYAYYKNGVLTLDNYKYEGERSITIYSSLGINLIGENTLVNTNKSDDIHLYLTITVMLTNSELVIEGTGSLNCIGGIDASSNIIINNTNVTVDGNGGAIGLRSYTGDVIVKGGRLTVIGEDSAIKVPHGDLLVTNDMKIQASTTVDGELGEYVAANNNSYKKIVITPPDVYVGGVGMNDGDYLAVGATETTDTQPSGGYAYYKDGELTLNNYSYEGKGYLYNSSKRYYAVIYSKNDLTLELIGSNTLIQTASFSHTIYVSGASLTVGGTGSLTNTDDGYGFYADQDITINSGTIHSTGHFTGIRSENGSVVINGGDVTVIGNSGIYASVKFVANGGTITATCHPNSSTYAIYTEGSVIFGSNMTVQASTTVDGELGEYVSANHDSYKKIVIKTAPIFDDVFETSWFKGAVDYVVGRGLMNGTSATKFEPNTPMSRAMLVTVLWRLEGSPAISGSNPFTDLKQAWYKDAVNWAYQNSIVNGTDADKFSPNGNITREQMAAILYRYSEYKGKDVSARADISAYPDASKVHSYAADAISWANAEGLITGSKEGNQTVLAPRASATRAQVATILMRFCNK